MSEVLTFKKRYNKAIILWGIIKFCCEIIVFNFLITGIFTEEKSIKNYGYQS